MVRHGARRRARHRGSRCSVVCVEKDRPQSPMVYRLLVMLMLLRKTLLLVRNAYC